MEKTVQFSVFKEKIIKTNELLHLHLDKTRELEKIQKCYQLLKNKLEQSKNEIKKFKLKDEGLSYNLKSSEKKYMLLQEEHDKLKLQFSQLEKEYNDTVNNLQVNYQLTNQELKECKEKLAKLEENRLPDIIKPKSPVKRKKAKTETSTTDSVVLNRKINDLTTHKEELVSANENLKLEVYQLKLQLSDFNCLKDDINRIEELEKQLNEKQQELNDLQYSLKNVEINKNKEIDRLTKELNKVSLENNRLEEENEKLNNENSSYKIEISMLLQENDSRRYTEEINKLSEDNKSLNEEINNLKNVIKKIEQLNSRPINGPPNVNTPTDQQIEDIMKDVTPPELLSPLTNTSEEGISPNVPALPHDEDYTSSQEDRAKSHSLKFPKVIKTTVSPSLTKKQVDSASGNFLISSFPKVMRVSKKRSVFRRKKRMVKKKAKEVDLYETLLALKSANINFIISSESLTLPNRINPQFLNSPSPRSTDLKIVPEKYSNKNITSKLECRLDCCKDCYMLLKGGQDEDAPMLGFFDIKDEKSKSPIDTGEIRCPKMIPLHRFKRRRKKPQQKININNNKDDSVSTLETENIYCLPSHFENTPEFSDSNVLSALDTASSKENDCLKVCQNRKKTDFHTVEKFQQKINTNNNKDVSVSTLETENICCLTSNFENTAEFNDDHVLSDHHNVADNTASLKESDCLKVCQSRKKRKSDSNTCVINKKKVVHHSYVTRTAQKARQNSGENDDYTISPQKKRIAHTPNLLTIVSDNVGKNDREVKKTPITRPKTPKTTFKRPVCRTRRSPRLLAVDSKPENEETIEKPQDERLLAVDSKPESGESTQKPQDEIQQNDEPPSCPRSPTPEKVHVAVKPKLIPLEKVPENTGKMPPSKIEVLFVKLINYSVEEETLNEVVREFSNQDPEYIAQAILEKVSKDYHDTPDTKYSPAPLMTETQRIMLGFMSKLEKSNVIGVFDSYLTLAEHRLLTCPVLQEIAPITRLYLAICKLHKDLHRMRKLCCDVFYFCGDFAVPFLFFVLTSWTEVLPHEANSKDMPLARVLVQIIYMKDCNKPGYNLLPLRDLLIKFYGYPSERWDSNELFQELFHAYLRNPVRSSDFALLLFCKNSPEKWVYDKIEEHLKPIIDKIPAENFKAAVIILIGNLYHRFTSISDTNYLPTIRNWLTSLITESTPDVVKRSVYLCLNRLAKK